MPARHAVDVLFLVFATLLPALAQDPTHWADDNVAVIEIEHLLPARGWVLETEHAGYSGNGYLTDRGGQELIMRVVLPRSGNWRVLLRNRHDHPDATLENDCMLSVNGSTPVKTLSNQGGRWNWVTIMEPSHGVFREPIFSLPAGISTIVIRGRSAGFRLDRVLVQREGATVADAQERAETPFIPLVPGLSELPTVARNWTRGELGKALQACRGAEPTEHVATLVERLVAIARARQVELTAARQEEPELAAALGARWAQCWRGSPEGAEFARQVATWNQDPAARAARAARQTFAPMDQAAARMLETGRASTEKARAELVALLRQFAASRPDTPAAREAAARAEALAALTP